MNQNRHKAKISSFEVVLPYTIMQQQDVTDWVVDTHFNFLKKFPEDLKKKRSLAELKKIFERFSCPAKKIAQRYFDNPDFLDSTPVEMKMYMADNAENEESHGAHIGKKMDYFLKRSTEVFKNFYDANKTPPKQIVHVTCTGYISPSAPQRIVLENGWQGQTGVTHAYHMGCYASLPAVRIADSMTTSHAFKYDEAYQVDVVHTEICSLHMDPRAHSPEQVVIQSLFADGHIKYSLDNLKPEQGRYFEVEKVSELLIPKSSDLMSWSPTFWGMEMALSRKVPEAIKQQIEPFLQNLLKDAGFELADALKNAIFAIHPGGPKIINEVQKALDLSEQQVRHSKAVLLARGNMSSATLPHVWKSILEDQNLQDRLIVSLAFGPGLTIFGSVFSMKS